jgi:hypothetical protein
MNLRGWIKMLFGRKRRAPEPETIIARELAQRIGVKADELSEHFRNYNRSRDPFAAMMADMYNRDQLSRLHRSNMP